MPWIFLSLALAVASTERPPLRFRTHAAVRACALALKKVVPLATLLGEFPKFRPYTNELSVFEWHRVNAFEYVGVWQRARVRAELTLNRPRADHDLIFGFGLHFTLTAPVEDRFRLLARLEGQFDGLATDAEYGDRMAWVVGEAAVAGQSLEDNVYSVLEGERLPRLLRFELLPDVIEPARRDLSRDQIDKITQRNLEVEDATTRLISDGLATQILAGARLPLERRITVTQTFFATLRNALAAWGD